MEKGIFYDRLLLALQSLRENYFIENRIFCHPSELTRDTMNRHFDGNRERRKDKEKRVLGDARTMGIEATPKLHKKLATSNQRKRHIFKR